MVYSCGCEQIPKLALGDQSIAGIIKSHSPHDGSATFHSAPVSFIRVLLRILTLLAGSTQIKAG